MIMLTHTSLKLSIAVYIPVEFSSRVISSTSASAAGYSPPMWQQSELSKALNRKTERTIQISSQCNLANLVVAGLRSYLHTRKTAPHHLTHSVHVLYFLYFTSNRLFVDVNRGFARQMVSCSVFMGFVSSFNSLHFSGFFGGWSLNKRALNIFSHTRDSV